MRKTRKMPIGEQSFEKIIRGGYAYVDKTAYVHRLAQEANPYFLTRPRRFGKSLLISTLDAYFQAKRELFEGLALAGLEEDWEPYPVIRIDLSGADYQTEEDIKISLDAILQPYEAAFGIAAPAPTPALRFKALLRTAANKAGKGVVVLVDEYDKPLLESLGDSALNAFYRDILRAFYGVLKGSSEHLRFVLLTGVTKFSQVSVFSDLNQLRDISMLDDYAAICGITEEELLGGFAAEIDALAENIGTSSEEAYLRIKRLYDGYHFSKHSPDVYNPFSVLNALASRELGTYWFQTGTPTYLVKLIRDSGFDVLKLQEGISASASAIGDFRVGQTNPVPVLYQSGYLTIKGYDAEFDSYELGFPNEEVEKGFLESLLPLFVGDAAGIGSDFDARRFAQDLAARDADAFLARLKSLYASVPYGPSKRDEHFYQSVFYIVFSLMGQFIRVEEHSHRGRSDAVVQTKDAVFVFEFKLCECDGADGAADAALCAAMRQIDASGYAEAHAASGKRLYKVAVAFDTGARNIVKWLVA
jgi:hypothetical protein